MNEDFTSSDTGLFGDEPSDKHLDQEEAVSASPDSIVVPADLDSFLAEGKRLYLSKGEGMAEENIRAFDLFHCAAVAGHAEAQYLLCRCFIDGHGTQPDLMEFIQWRQRAAESGHAQAQYELGDNYYYGRLLVEKNYKEAVKWWEKAAEQGHSDAQNNLGYCYKYAVGVAQDYELAVKWFRKAADQGHAAAQDSLGHCYYRGQGVPQDYVEATQWIRKSAEQGNIVAQDNLGFCYGDGLGVPQDKFRAYAWFQLAADQGDKKGQEGATALAALMSPSEFETADQLYRELKEKYFGECETDPEAQFKKGNLFWSGWEGGQPDKMEAIRWYRKSANNNFIEAILRLARINDYEPGCDRNPQKAFHYYKQAAELGSPYAQYCVGTCYADGFGVLKDDAEAFRWFLKSAKQKPPGFSAAQHAVGVCYRDGQGVTQDYSQAVQWFRKAAEQGLAVAQYDLANAYRLGKGTTQNFVEAAEWYQKAALQGDRAAQHNLGVCHFRGVGLAQSYAEGMTWYRKAAEQGQANAQFNLGLCYRDGDGTEIDWPQAYAWFDLAADQGCEKAKEEAAALLALMSLSEFETAQRLYREFKDKSRAPRRQSVS